jgi:hypothetical protein
MGAGAGQAGVATAPAPSGPVEHTGATTTGFDTSQAAAKGKVDSESSKPQGRGPHPSKAASAAGEDPGTHQGLGAPLELVVDGRSLGHVLPDRGLREQLAQLCAL